MVRGSPDETSVEIRPSLGKKLELSEIKLHENPVLTKSEETKAEESEVENITRNTVDNGIGIEDMDSDRVEIIDLRSLNADDVFSQKKSILLIGRNDVKDADDVSKNRDTDGGEEKNVDTKKTCNDKSDELFITTLQKPEQNNGRPRVYYFGTNEEKYEESKKLDKADGDEPGEEKPSGGDKTTRSKGFPRIRFRKKEDRMKLKEESKCTTLSEKNCVEGEKRELSDDFNFTSFKKELEETKERIEEKLKELEEAEKKEIENKEEMKKKEFEKMESVDPKIQILEEKMRKKEERRLRKLEAKRAKMEAKERKKELKQRKKEEKKLRKMEKARMKSKEKGRDEEGAETKEMSKDEEEESFFLDEDVKKVLLVMDDLLGELPDDVIDRFSKSEDFALYEKIFAKYKIK
jgi:hypothetical protein